MSVPFLKARYPRVARPLDRCELIAYLMEKAWRKLQEVEQQHPRPENYRAIERAWEEADEALWAITGPGAYNAAQAWAEQHFDEIVEPRRVTLSEAIAERQQGGATW